MPWELQQAKGTSRFSSLPHAMHNLQQLTSHHDHISPRLTSRSVLCSFSLPPGKQRAVALLYSSLIPSPHPLVTPPALQLCAAARKAARVGPALRLSHSLTSPSCHPSCPAATRCRLTSSGLWPFFMPLPCPHPTLLSPLLPRSFALPPDKQRAVAQETRQVWCTLAERLGIVSLKVCGPCCFTQLNTFQVLFSLFVTCIKKRLRWCTLAERLGIVSLKVGLNSATAAELFACRVACVEFSMCRAWWRSAWGLSLWM